MTTVRVGSVFRGYCGGRFGRDGYGTKRVEAIGADWVVVRYEADGRPDLAVFASAEDTERETSEWLADKGYDE